MPLFNKKLLNFLVDEVLVGVGIGDLTKETKFTSAMYDGFEVS